MKEFDFGDFTITFREILASISIVAILLLIGVLISSKISAYQLDKNEVYNKAIKIDDTEMFEYGMRTNVGNAFVYGELAAVDTVTYPDIEGEYIYIEKVKEKYTKHYRTVTKTKQVNGKTVSYTEKKEYWTWDVIDRESKQCKEISFCGVVFDVGKINIPGTYCVDTIKESSKIRYTYYAVDKSYTGTIFTRLRDNTISDYSDFYNGQDIQTTIESLESDGEVVVFWIFWVVLIGLCLFGFFYIDNNWLE